MLALFARRRRRKETALRLYSALLERARDPALFSRGAVADTPEGRLEMLAGQLVVMIERLGRSGEQGKALAQSVVEAFVSDMDSAVREMGIGDAGVAKRVKKAAGALYDRHRAYAAGLAGRARMELAAAIDREARAGIGHGADVAFLAEQLIIEADRLEAVSDAALLAGESA